MSYYLDDGAAWYLVIVVAFTNEKPGGVVSAIHREVSPFPLIAAVVVFAETDVTPFERTLEGLAPLSHFG